MIGKETQLKGMVLQLPPDVTIHDTEVIINGLMSNTLEEENTLVDATEVNSIDACGLQILLAGAKEAKVKGKRFIIQNPSTYLTNVLEITGAAKVVEVQREG